MKKSDVELRYDRGTWRPTINVKWHPYMPGIIAKFERSERSAPHEFDNDAEFWEWVHETLDDDAFTDDFDTAYEIARELGWEDAIDLAAEVLPQSTAVWSDGRSGGWLVVDGLPDVESWDAIQLGKWARFVKGVQMILDDLDYQFIWHLNVNVWEPHNEQAKRLAARMVMS